VPGLGVPPLAFIAIVLFLAFAASGITWLIASVTPGAITSGRRQVGIVAIVTGALLTSVLFIGALLAPQRAIRDGFPRPNPPFPGQPAPGQPFPGQPQPLPPAQSPQPTR
jgi:hypothetical protein